VKTVSGKDFTKLLEKKGRELRRIKGSHHIYTKPGNPARVSVPVHGNNPLKIGLLKYLIKVADMTENDL